MGAPPLMLDFPAFVTKANHHASSCPPSGLPQPPADPSWPTVSDAACLRLSLKNFSSSELLFQLIPPNPARGGLTKTR